MSNDDAPSSGKASRRIQGFGCAVGFAVLNLVPMGLIAVMFQAMSYANAEQEAWYRGGSMAFLVMGAIVPILWLILMKRGFRGNIAVIIGWLGAALIAFAGYVLVSGGGL